LGDNDFEALPPEFGRLRSLQIVSTIYNGTYDYFNISVIQVAV